MTEEVKDIKLPGNYQGTSFSFEAKDNSPEDKETTKKCFETIVGLFIDENLNKSGNYMFYYGLVDLPEQQVIEEPKAVEELIEEAALSASVNRMIDIAVSDVIRN